MASVFKFFELPPELRNFVYRNLTSEEATAVALPAWNKWDEAWEASIELYVDTALLTVSKQFKQEYENEVCPDSVLRVTCTAHEVIATTIRPVKLPGSILENITHMELDVHLGDWTGTQALLKEKYTLLLSCRLPNIQTLSLDLVISSELVEDWFDTMNASESVADFFRRVETFSAACARMYRNADVDVGVFVREQLYHIPVPDTLNTASEDIVQGYGEQVKDLSTNWLSYRASLSETGDQYPFYGMRLDFEGCGSFDERACDELLDEALTKWDNDSVVEEPMVAEGSGERSSSEAESDEEDSDEGERFSEE